LAHRLRARVAANEQPAELFGAQLAVMARDRNIRAELQSIDREFAATESDGLTRD